ncbi:MAG: AbrB/MazE/SpoVT family DNA-binding domain-containing protein, partial [Halohasta sp.]
MPRVTTKGQVTIPKAIREALGIEPGEFVADQSPHTEAVWDCATGNGQTAIGLTPYFS